MKKYLGVYQSKSGNLKSSIIVFLAVLVIFGAVIYPPCKEKIEIATDNANCRVIYQAVLIAEATGDVDPTDEDTYEKYIGKSIAWQQNNGTLSVSLSGVTYGKAGYPSAPDSGSGG